MNGRSAAIERGLAWFDDPDTGFFPTLADRVAIPTESQNPERLSELYRYLEENIRPAFDDMGFEVRIYDNPFQGQGPVLLATRIEHESLPTILGYGHGDTVRGQEDRWTKGQGPWKLTRDGERIYGRGTSDNKAQHTTHLGALKAVIETRGSLGFNCKFMVETGEENGSKGLKELVAREKAAFSADAYFASDGPRVNLNRPNLTLGNRGCLNFDLVLEFRDGGHHSGNLGGLLSNPGIVLAHALASIVDSHGQILVDGWKPAPISNSIREALKDV
ncbi:MAG: M20/M25/M40 family metallo-hydrolase, partial [Proteobacteria bacterium]|nr:M20/M25/M40 family metallo-hydrolase [Pseudomonadota bacterium]